MRTTLRNVIYNYIVNQFKSEFPGRTEKDLFEEALTWDEDLVLFLEGGLPSGLSLNSPTVSDTYVSGSGIEQFVDSSKKVWSLRPANKGYRLRLSKLD